MTLSKMKASSRMMEMATRTERGLELEAVRGPRST